MFHAREGERYFDHFGGFESIMVILETFGWEFSQFESFKLILVIWRDDSFGHFGDSEGILVKFRFGRHLDQFEEFRL